MSPGLDLLRDLSASCHLYKLATFPSEDTFDNLLCAIHDNNGVGIVSVPQIAPQSCISPDREDSYVYVDERHESQLRNPVSLTRELLLDVSYVIAESCGCPPHLALVRILRRLRTWRLVPLEEPEREASHVARLLADITHPPLSVNLDTKSTSERTSRAEIPRRLDGDAKCEGYTTLDHTNRERCKDEQDPSDVHPAPIIPPTPPQTGSSLSGPLHDRIFPPCTHFRNGCSACCIPRRSSALAIESSVHQIEDIIPCSSITAVPGLISEMPDSANCTDLDGRRDEPLYPKEGFVHGADALPPSLVSPAVFPGTENTGQIQMTEYTSSKPQSHTPKTPKRQTPSQSRNPRDKIKHAPGALSSSSSAYNSSQAIPPIPSATQTPRQKSIQSATSSSGSSVRVRLGENFNPGSTTPAMPNGRRDVSIKPTPTTPYRRNWRP